MNSLADAAAQASATAPQSSPAAAATAAAAASASTSQAATPSAPPPLSTAAASLSDPPSRPESTSSLVLGRSSSTHLVPSQFDPTFGASQRDRIDAPISPTSFSDSPAAADMIKSSADTPVRRALLDSEKPEKRGSNLACLKCRAIKVKCSRANIKDDRCKRCNRLDLVCEFKEHHRGRKPKKRARSDADSTGADEEDQLEDDEIEAGSFSAKANATSPVRVKPRELSRSPPPPASSAARQPQHHSTSSYKKSDQSRFDTNDPPSPKLPSPKGSVHGRWFGPYLQPIPSFEDSLFSRKPHSHSSAAHHQQQYGNQSQQGPQHHSSYHLDRSRELPPLAIPSSSSNRSGGVSPNDQGAWDRTSAWSSAQNSLHRAQPTTSATAPTIASDLRDDAVRQHIISMDQAHELFSYFFTELNPPLALLDTSLHTVEHVRQNLPILFSTILSVASRFFLPQHHRQCHRIAKSILNLAAADEICSMDHIQALVLVITWKDPGDRTILRKAVRAIGYAYELGLHASFDDYQTSETSSSCRGNDATRARSDSYTLRYRRRQDRDRQRTWIVLCLVHELVRRDDRNTKPRARVIPPEDLPDPHTWIKQAGDVLLPVDSRLAWSLDMSILTLENEPFLDLIDRSQDAMSFESFFERYRSRLDILRKRYFDVRQGVFHPRFPMDKSAVAEIPYLDAFRDFYICQSTWHWAAKVASQHRSSRSELAEQQDSARSAFWFAQTVDTAMRCMRLFAQDLCEPGYVRVGHDYLVISASEVTKWFYLYREHLDASTITAGVEYLRATLRECSQPQRLATGEVVDTEREAPGYFVRFLGAIFDAGLNQSFEKAKSHLKVDVERFRARPSHWSDVGRGRALSGGAAAAVVDEHVGARRDIDIGHGHSNSSSANAAARRQPWGGAQSSYQQQQQQQQQQQGGGAGQAAVDRCSNAMAAGGSPPFRDVASAAARYSTAPSLPRGRSDVGLNRLATHAASSGGVTSYERGAGSNGGGGGMMDKPQTSPLVFGQQQQQDVQMTNAPPFNAGNSMAPPHPAYLASPGSNQGQTMPSQFQVQQGGGAPWSTANNNIASSWNTNSNSNALGGGGSGMLASHTSMADLPASADFNAVGFGSPNLAATKMGTANAAAAVAATAAVNVVPLAADIGKNSIEGLAACLNTRDLTYWQDILGFDLATPTV